MAEKRKKKEVFYKKPPFSFPEALQAIGISALRQPLEKEPGLGFRLTGDQAFIKFLNQTPFFVHTKYRPGSQVFYNKQRFAAIFRQVFWNDSSIIVT